MSLLELPPHVFDIIKLSLGFQDTIYLCATCHEFYDSYINNLFDFKFKFLKRLFEEYKDFQIVINNKYYAFLSYSSHFSFSEDYIPGKLTKAIWNKNINDLFSKITEITSVHITSFEILKKNIYEFTIINNTSNHRKSYVKLLKFFKTYKNPGYHICSSVIDPNRLALDQMIYRLNGIRKE